MSKERAKCCGSCTHWRGVLSHHTDGFCTEGADGSEPTPPETFDRWAERTCERSYAQEVCAKHEMRGDLWADTEWERTTEPPETWDGTGFGPKQPGVMFDGDPEPPTTPLDFGGIPMAEPGESPEEYVARVNGGGR